MMILLQGISRISYLGTAPNPPNIYTYNSVAGQGVDVYVIDTGILVTHQDFGGRAIAVFNSITNEQNTDLNGHGTHVCTQLTLLFFCPYFTSLLVCWNYWRNYLRSCQACSSFRSEGIECFWIWNHCWCRCWCWLCDQQQRQNPPSCWKVLSFPSLFVCFYAHRYYSMSLGGGASTALDNSVANSIASGVPYAIAAGNDNGNACKYGADSFRLWKTRLILYFSVPLLLELPLQLPLEPPL